MKRTYKFTVSLLMVMMLGVCYVQAQNLNQGNELEDIEIVVLEVPEGLYLDKQVPHYYTSTPSGRLAIAAGANVRVTNTFDIAGIIQNSYDAGFIVPYIPSSMAGLSKGQYYLNANTSQIYLKGAGILNNGRIVEGYLSANFMGDNNRPQLYQAYIKLYNMTIGKAWNIFADIEAAAPTVDYWGPSGFTGMRNATVRYENWISNCFNFGAAIEMPEVQADYSANNHAVTQLMPDVSAYLQFNWGYEGESTIRLSALYRNMTYYNDVKSKTVDEGGYAVQLSGKANILPHFIAYYRAMAGYGVGSYINDLSVMPTDLVRTNADDGSMTTLGMYGAYAGLRYNISPKVFVTGTYSQARIYSRSTVTIDTDTYRYSQYIVGNCFWNVSENLQLAAEYLHGIKSDFLGGCYDANRVNLMIQYAF